MNKEIDISKVRINTKRSLLRPFEKNDLEDFFEYAKVEGVGERAGRSHHKSIDETRVVLDIFIERKNTFAIVVDGRVIGSIGIEKYDEEVLQEFSHKKGREIGYVISKDYRGQGLATEVVTALVKYLFDVEKLDFIVAGHFDENLASRRVQEKCGFKHYKKRKIITNYGETKDGWLSILEKNSQDRD